MKEGEAKEAVENKLRKNAEHFSQDAQKFDTAVKSAEKDNQTMKTKLQEMVKALNELSNNKIQIAGKLDQRHQEFEEVQRLFTLESDEQNKHISGLHEELKDLQDKINKYSHKGDLLGNKYKELNETQYKVEAEQAESILKLKSEHERLKSEHNDLHFKVAKFTKEVEHTNVALEKSSHEKMQAGDHMDQTLANISDRLKDANQLNKQLDAELNNASQDYQDQEVRTKEEASECITRFRETKKQLEKTKAEHQALQVKLTDTDQTYRKIYSENEQMLIEFEDTKQH